MKSSQDEQRSSKDVGLSGEVIAGSLLPQDCQRHRELYQTYIDTVKTMSQLIPKGLDVGGDVCSDLRHVQGGPWVVRYTEIPYL